MGRYQRKAVVEIARLGKDLTIVTEWKTDWQGNRRPKELVTIPAGNALVIDGEGVDQEIYGMPWNEALQQFEPTDEVTHRTSGGNRQQQQGKRNNQQDPRSYERDDRTERRHDDVQPLMLDPGISAWRLPTQATTAPAWSDPNQPTTQVVKA